MLAFDFKGIPLMWIFGGRGGSNEGLMGEVYFNDVWVAKFQASGVLSTSWQKFSLGVETTDEVGGGGSQNSTSSSSSSSNVTGNIPTGAPTSIPSSTLSLSCRAHQGIDLAKLSLCMVVTMLKRVFWKIVGPGDQNCGMAQAQMLCLQALMFGDEISVKANCLAVVLIVVSI